MDLKTGGKQAARFRADIWEGGCGVYSTIFYPSH